MSSINSLIGNSQAVQDSAKNVSNSLSKAENDLIKAYSGDAREVADLKRRYGKAEMSDEALQSILQMKVQKAQRAFSAFMQIMDSAHQMMMKVINQIRA